MIGWIAGGIVGTIAFVLRSRTGAWYSPFVRIFTVLFFFLLPVAMLSELLSEPLHEQGLLPPVPLVWFDLPLSISGCHRYWTQFVAAVAQSKAAIYLAVLLTTQSLQLTADRRSLSIRGK